MSGVCGIDVSSYAIDCVLLDEDGGEPIWKRYELHGQDAWERTRNVPKFGSWTDDVIAFGMEQPQARGTKFIGSLMVTNRIVGAVLVQLPRTALVEKWQPSGWRTACAIPGNASKGLVKAQAIAYAIRTWGSEMRGRMMYPSWVDAWPQDAWDAFCIARATAGAYRIVEVDGGSVSSVG